MMFEGKPLNFDRKVYVTFVKSDGTNTCIAYDPVKRDNVDELNARIDGKVKKIGSIGVLKTTDAYHTCHLILHNIGRETIQFLDVYNKTDEFGNLDQNKIMENKIAVNVQVGFRDTDLKEIFVGWLNSFYVERVQTDKSVDNSWHFFCSFPSNNSWERKPQIPDKSKDQTTEPKTNQAFPSVEEWVKNTIIQKNVDVFSSVSIPLLLGSIIDSNSLQKGYSYGGEMVVRIPKSEYLTLQDFGTYFEFYYADDEIKNMFQKDKNAAKKTSRAIDKRYSMWGMIDEMVKMLGVKFSYCYKEPDKITLAFFKTDRKAKTTGQQPYVIRNFQNLIDIPTVRANGLSLKMILEPRIQSMNGIGLRINSLWKDNEIPSFVANYGNLENTTLSTNKNFLVEQSNTSDKAKQTERFGNIFENVYMITSVEHSFSTHDSTWETSIETGGIMYNENLPSDSELYQQGLQDYYA